MPNVCLAAGLRLSVSIFLFWMGNALAWGQVYDNPSEASKVLPFGYFPWRLGDLDDSASSFTRSPRFSSTGPATVSIDVLRHPLSLKARCALEKAMQQAERGNHAAAVEGLRQALAKYPADAAYTYNVLGLEYIKNQQYADAKQSFEEAARLMPNESCNHSNYGLSLAIAGELDTAEKEERKALALDRGNAKAKLILEVLSMNKHRRPATLRP